MVNGLILEGLILQVGDLQGSSVPMSVSVSMSVLGGHRQSLAVPARLASTRLPLLCSRRRRGGRISKGLGVCELFHDGALKAWVVVRQLDHDGAQF